MSHPSQEPPVDRAHAAAAGVTEDPWLPVNEERLSTTLAEFAHNLVLNFSIQEILDRLVESVAEVLGLTGAGVVMRGSDDEMHFVAATDDVVLRIEYLQIELGEGPCLTATRTGEQVLVPDIAADRRFAEFSPPAATAGLAGVYSFPLHSGNTIVGALDLYSDRPRRLADRQLVAAQILADVAAVYISNAQSRTDARQSADQLRHRLLHDPLTGLPNRMLLDDRIKQAVASSTRSGATAGLLFLDLDRFKSVNDSFGHRTGDLLLVAVANRLREVLRPGDTLARLAGDEFVVICEDLAELKQAEEVAGRIVSALRRPFAIEGHQIVVGVSIGIAAADDASGGGAEPLRDADAAMYSAKQHGGGRFQTADQRLQQRASRRRGIERDLHAGIDGDDLRLDFQPIVEAATGRWDGVEALLRWDHPQARVVSPEAIVAAADRTGLTLALGEWVTRRACSQMRTWIDSGEPHPATVAVNVSAPELLHPAHCGVIVNSLKDYALAPERLCLEITERDLVTDVRAAFDALRTLREIGVTIALDDFGTGYSSLNYLKRFPVNVVKIDRSFIVDLADDPIDEAIVVAVTNLAHRLGLEVVAEGVETSSQRDHVVELGCDRIQGYLFSRPLPATAVLGATAWTA